MENKDIYIELLDIGYQQDQTMKLLQANAELLQSLSTAEPQELPDIVIPDTVTISNLPEIQKVEIINSEKVELGNVEKLLGQLIKLVPTIKDERPTPTEDIKKLVGLLGNDTSKEKVLDLLKKILEKEYPSYQLPTELISKEGRIKVEVDRAGSGGSGITKESIDALIGNDALRMVEVGQIIYLGKAEIATVTSAAKWQIKKIDQTNGIIITWADGNDLFDNIFDDYLTLNYL